MSYGSQNNDNSYEIELRQVAANTRTMMEVLLSVRADMRRRQIGSLIVTDDINGEPYFEALKTDAEVIGLMTHRTPLSRKLAREFTVASLHAELMPHHLLMLGEVENRRVRWRQNLSDVLGPDMLYNYEVPWAPGASRETKELGCRYYQQLVPGTP